MGTPDRYYEVEKDILSGKVKARNLSHKQKAIFLDRDGTIFLRRGKMRNYDNRLEDWERLRNFASVKRIIL